MKKRLYNFFIGGEKFKREFKRQLRLLIIMALGFTIAFTWRQTIFDISQTFVHLITNIENSTALTILTSSFITLFSLGLIYLTSYFLKDSWN